MEHHCIYTLAECSRNGAATLQPPNFIHAKPEIFNKYNIFIL